ncbi:branched-chain alpha-keto acid dehydrogenase subunit E2 [Aliiroseovarius zhejiangensis]|uniref:Endolytic murein transglycosylase n=1 Tax=Aliiroseovarius zhejiangensis TaxID=1632025 RepID=A0ABQ3IJI3_9RHOB|nr:endolytic transglycosylase MltG [Aliiroseovarius zhejiangensis]GHE86463.1 branched-chain alpha-keto acid dehydrogenase subunit E2 [Aliiroseovarius zhejiangensis]
MWRNIASNALSLFVVIMIVAIGMIAWGKRQYTGAGPLTEAICLRVEKGSNFSRVTNTLTEQGAISNATIFRLGVEYSDKKSQLKAGSFLVPEGASMEDIVDVVTRGGASTCGTEVVYRIGVLAAEVQVRELDPATQEYEITAEFNPAEQDTPVPETYQKVRNESDTRYRIALAEGVTSWQIVDSLNHADFLDGEVAEVPAEGTLAPDSYEVRVGADRAALLAEMQAAQSAILAAAWEARAPDLPYDSPEEALIMASIVEKETGVAEERRQVASVFVNRLNQGMRLQTDPTVIYGVTKGQGALGRGLRQSELRSETPYNTYVIDGLPPTPIANPGKAAIEAALNPDDTDFIFFVADGTGGHAFAETLEEHNRNVAKWREIEAERANQ